MTKWLFHLPIEVSKNPYTTLKFRFNLNFVKQQKNCLTKQRCYFIFGRKYCYAIKYFSFRENPNNFCENIFIATLVINDHNNPTQWNYSMSVALNNQ